MSNPDLRRPKSIRDLWQDAGGLVWTQQPEVQGFQVLHDQVIHWALHLIKTLWFRRIHVCLCQICAAMLIRRVQFSSMFFFSRSRDSFFKYIWVTELCEEINSATCNTRTWVCVCIVNLYVLGVKSKRSTTFLFLSVVMETWHPASDASLSTRLKNKGVNTDRTGWKMIQRILYLFSCVAEWFLRFSQICWYDQTCCFLWLLVKPPNVSGARI